MRPVAPIAALSVVVACGLFEPPPLEQPTPPVLIDAGPFDAGFPAWYTDAGVQALCESVCANATHATGSIQLNPLQCRCVCECDLPIPGPDGAIEDGGGVQRFYSCFWPTPETAAFDRDLWLQVSAGHCP